MIILLKYFHDSLNIVVILDPGFEVFSAKYAQLPLTFTEWEHFPFGTAIINFWDTPYLDINIKNLLKCVILCK